MKENLKIFLLGVIALASVISLFKGPSSPATEEAAQANINSTAVAGNVSGNNQAFDPTTQSAPENTTHIIPPSADIKKTTIRWTNMVHDFGKIKQNSENKFSFQFTNSGTEPLIITNAVGSRGCTVPDYPKEPVAPGATASINVVYKPGLQQDQQEKTVTVTANTEPLQTTLKIRAFVEK